MAQSVFAIVGFETGDASEVPGVFGTSSIQTGTVRTGGYALKQDNSGAYTPSGMAATRYVVRFYFRVPAIPGATTNFIQDSDVSIGVLRATLGLKSTGKINLSDASGTMGLSALDGTKVLSVNTWYRIEMACDLGAGGVVKVWVDGTLDINTTHTSNVSATPVDRFLIFGAASPNQYFFDDMRFDVGGVAAVGAGQIIARQGIAGTPTYDAWTKNGAATAALCWSETPFATGKNCTKATSGAQTMLVGAFNTAGSGTEGAQTIGGADIINGCKTAIIGKTALASNGTIRRRIGGVDSDTTVSLTTADKYFDDGIWTTTVANLNSAEIGAVASTANLDTVEDCWLIVDYTPVVVPLVWKPQRIYVNR